MSDEMKIKKIQEEERNRCISSLRIAMTQIDMLSKEDTDYHIGLLDGISGCITLLENNLDGILD